jgi:hypothetical protein
MKISGLTLQTVHTVEIPIVMDSRNTNEVLVMVFKSPPEVEFMNDNFRKISRLLPNAIHKCVFPLDLSLAIDFQVQGLDPGFLSQ